MKKIFLIISIIIISFSLHAQKIWTLDECFEYAMEHNVTILQSIISQNNAAAPIERRQKSSIGESK